MSKEYPQFIEPRGKRYKLIACEIMFREACYLLSQTENVVDVVFLEKGLHDIGAEKMYAAIQAEVDKVDADEYEAILLGYGLCNNGICGLNAKIPVVIPRAHDCITLFMGSKERYKAYFDANPGTYFKSSGWVERADSLTTQGAVNNGLIHMSYEEYAEEYGEENAEYLMEMLGNWVKNYKKMTYIDVSVTTPGGEKLHFGDREQYIAMTKEKAVEHEWAYEELEGNVRLIKKMIAGDWPESEFLVLQPGERVINDIGDQIIAAQPAK